MALTDSLRIRLLAPLIAAGCVAAAVVAWISYRNAQGIVERQLELRANELTRVLASPHYPLSEPVLRMLAGLTDCQLIAVASQPPDKATTGVSGANADESSKHRTIVAATLESLQRIPSDGTTIRHGGVTYLCRSINVSRNQPRADGVDELILLLNTERLHEAQWRAAMLPLLTGFVVLALLSTVWIITSTRLVSRLRRLQTRFGEISKGKFRSADSHPPSRQVPRDEIDRLAESAEHMAGSLQQLWNQVNRQQSERVIHQVAAGMAHQLRNSLTGARIAIELEARNDEQSDAENLTVALHQIESSESYVKQLLMLASGKRHDAVPARVDECVSRMSQTFAPVVRHRKKDLRWQVDDRFGHVRVAEGSTWSAAVSNLIQNALDAGQHIQVSVTLTNGNLQTTVIDDGPGMDPTIANQWHEPLVTTKPEGLGFGLAVAQRAAVTLGGSLSYEHRNQQTRFTLTCPIAS